MTSEIFRTHPPGSDKAHEAGCICPRMDNSYGRGLYRDRITNEPVFVFTEECPIHGPTVKETA